LKTDKNLKRNDVNSDTAITLPIRREPELELLIGEINVADFQSRRIKNALNDRIAGYVHLGAGYYRKNQKDNNTTNTFYHMGRLYRISLSVGEVRS
jgi:hypothetical protein